MENYNSNPHRVIKMAPDDVKPANYKQVKRNILERDKKSQRFQGVVYKPGDFVRLKIYKPKRLKPTHMTSLDGGADRWYLAAGCLLIGCLRTMLRTGAPGRPPADFAR
eukprot:SAG25_NODE_5723_length_626_cov_1.333966_1_plen_108_part_00